MLVRDEEFECWHRQIFDYYDETGEYPYCCIGEGKYKHCIPYEGNEKIAGTRKASYIGEDSVHDGDLIYSCWSEEDGRSCAWVAILKGDFSPEYYETYAGAYLHKNNDDEPELWIDEPCSSAQHFTRLATEEERKFIFDKLHENEYDWNAEKKQIVEYVPAYEPKDGDFVYVENSRYKYIFIKKVGPALTEKYISLNIEYGNLSDECHKCCDDECIISIRPATEEEKNLLLSKLHENGKDWDPEKKEIVDWKWKPKVGELVYFYDWCSQTCRFINCSIIYDLTDGQVLRDKKGNCYATKEECQEMCEKLNEAIKNVRL